MVLLRGRELGDAPQSVQDAIASPEAHGAIPILVAYDAQVERMAGVVPYMDMKDATGFDVVKSKLAEFRGVTPEAAVPQVVRASESWTSADGRKISAAYLSSTADSVTLRLGNGRPVTMPLERLDDASQKRVASYATESGKKS